MKDEKKRRHSHNGTRSKDANKNVCSSHYQTLISHASAGDAQVLANQVLRAGTSVGAHYREAGRAKSDADFISKIEGALQELDETAYWLELIGEAEILPMKRLEPLHAEAEELMAILVTIVTRVKRKNPKRAR